MSFLEMTKAPLPDMKKGIISLWFRDAGAGTPPKPKDWPPGMIPPDTQAIVQTMVPSARFYWNAYGMPVEFLPQIKGPASVYMPLPPPVPDNNMRMLLTFGDPNQKYNYRSWKVTFPGVLDAVNYASTETGIGFRTGVWPPPYAPYFKNVGSDGKFKIATMEIASLPASPPDLIPQSFVGVDKDGYLTICLQTSTRANYKGCAFALDRITPLWAAASFLQVREPFTYTQVGFPFPDGDWIQVEGYWNGYQFEYKDVSNEVMGAQPESFVIGGPGVFLDFIPGPRVTGPGWHHLLFSFDISGSVTALQSASKVYTATTACKFWLAVDDVNYKGMALQRRRLVHDGLLLPLLPGVPPDIIGYGPVTSLGRGSFKPALGDNDILPQNVWIVGFKGYPRDGLVRFTSAAPVLKDGNAWTPPGDFNVLAWTGSVWPLYGNGVAPGPWLPVLTPPRPTVPDPATALDLPQYRCDSFSIPVNGHPIGIPASARHLKHNTGIEMGELQIWANKTLDVGDKNMRRLFIDYPKDNHGNPDSSKPLQPVSPQVAAERLGKPDILLHGTNNWKKGFNTGRSGYDDDGNINPDGQFKPTAEIEKFLPDPAIGA